LPVVGEGGKKWGRRKRGRSRQRGNRDFFRGLGAGGLGGRENAMGKKQKRKRTVGLSTSSPRTGSPIPAIKGVEQVFTLDGETREHVDDENDVASGAVSMEEPGLIGCKHLESGLNLEKLGRQLARGGLVSQCHECSQVLSRTRRDKEGCSKVVKRKGTSPSAADGTGGQKLWICLVCGVINCGSSLSLSEKPQQSGDGEEIVKMEALTMPCTGLSHAKQHSLDREPSHPLAMEWGEDLACWCFVCEVKVDYSFSSALNLASKGEDAPSSKLESLQQAAKLVQDKLAQEANNVDAAATSDDQGSESKVDEPAEVSSSNSIEAEVKPVKERRIIKGLMNLGNTCFFNSVMQNLLGVDMLWEHFSVEGSVQEGPLTTALRKFFQEIDPKSDESFDFRIHDAGLSSSFRRTTRACLFSSSIGNTYTPRDLFGAISMKAPRFKGFQQQDSHELLRCLLDGLHTEEETLWKVTNPGRIGQVTEWATDVEPDVFFANRGSSKLQGKRGEDREGESMKKKRETFVEKIFGGQLSSTVRCCLCGHSSVVYEPILDLSLPIPSKQPNKKAVVHKDQAQVSSGQQSERLQALGKGSKGLEPLDQPKTPTMTAVANSWGSGDTDQASQSVTQGVICLPYYPSFMNGSSSYGQDDGDDVSSLKPENLAAKEGTAFNPTEDQAAQTILPPVICLPYVPTVSSRSSTFVEDLDKDFGWMDYPEDAVKASSHMPTGITVHGGSSVTPEELLTAVPEAQQSVDEGQQILDAGNEGSMVFKHFSSGHQTFGNFEDTGYSTLASYGSAEEPCGMNEINGSASVGDTVFYGPNPCPTSEASDNWNRPGEGEGQQQQKLEILTSESVPLLLGKGNDRLAAQRTNLAGGACKQTEVSVTSMQLHSGATGCEIGKISYGESVLATSAVSEKDHIDFDGVADLFEDGSYGEEREDGRQAESTRQESSSSLIQMDDFSSVLDLRNSGSNRVKRDEFYCASNGGVLGLKEEDEGEEDGSFPMSLEGCLLAFTKSELLSGENAWGCENCSRQLHERQEEASSLKSSNNLDLESRRQDAMSGTQLQGSGKSLVQGTGTGVTKTSEVRDGKNIEMQIQTDELPKVEVLGGTGTFETSKTLEDALNGMNLVTVGLVQNRTLGKHNDYTNRESWKGEATSCSTTNEVAPQGEKEATLQGDAKAGVSKLKTHRDQEGHFSMAFVSDWEDLADLNVPSTSSTGLMYADSQKPSVCQPPTDSYHTTESGENDGSRNGGANKIVQDSEIGPLSLHSHMTGADAAGYILCSGDRRSKVDDTVESAIGHKLLQLNQMQQTVCYGDSYSGVQMGLASTNKLESRKSGDDHVGGADVQPKMPSVSSGTCEANGAIQVSTINADRYGMVPEILSATDRSRRTALRPLSGLSALAGDLSSLHDGHAKSLKADRMKSQKVEEPPKVMVKRDAEKRFLISKAPPILTVHLKRFAQDMRGRLSKLSGHVRFHELLDISPFMDQRCVFLSVTRLFWPQSFLFHRMMLY